MLALDYQIWDRFWVSVQNHSSWHHEKVNGIVKLQECESRIHVEIYTYWEVQIGSAISKENVKG